MAFKFLSNTHGVQVYVADADTDLANIPEKLSGNYVCGTTVKVIGNGKTYMMKSDGTWAEV